MLKSNQSKKSKNKNKNKNKKQKTKKIFSSLIKVAWPRQIIQQMTLKFLNVNKQNIHYT